MKGKIIGIVIVVMLAITGVAGYFTYQKAEAEEKADTEKMNKIKESENQFSKTEEHTEEKKVAEEENARQPAEDIVID